MPFFHPRLPKKRKSSVRILAGAIAFHIMCNLKLFIATISRTLNECIHKRRLLIAVFRLFFFFSEFDRSAVNFIFRRHFGIDSIVYRFAEDNCCSEWVFSFPLPARHNIKG